MATISCALSVTASTPEAAPPMAPARTARFAAIAESRMRAKKLCERGVERPKSLPSANGVIVSSAPAIEPPASATPPLGSTPASTCSPMMPPVSSVVAPVKTPPATPRPIPFLMRASAASPVSALAFCWAALATAVEIPFLAAARPIRPPIPPEANRERIVGICSPVTNCAQSMKSPNVLMSSIWPTVGSNFLRFVHVV